MCPVLKTLIYTVKIGITLDLVSCFNIEVASNHDSVRVHMMTEK